MFRRISHRFVSRIRWRSQRDLHTGQLYVHHTIAGLDQAGISLGLITAIKKLRPDVGYFRPIDPTSSEGELSRLVKNHLRLEDDSPSFMRGIDQNKAYQLLANDNIDDLLEQIFVAYEAYKRRHDFVLIEGTHLDNLCKDTASLNASIASALGSNVFLATDASLIMQNFKLQENMDKKVAEQVANRTKVASLAFKKLNVAILGALVHGMNILPGLEYYVKNLLLEAQLPFAGYVPANVRAKLPEELETLFEDNIENEVLKEAVWQEAQPPLSPLLFRNSILTKARQKKQVILLPEGDEPRTVQAAAFVLKHELCDLIMLGKREDILQVAKQQNVELPSSAIIKSSLEPQELEKYAQVYYEARKHKGVTMDKALEVITNDPITLGTCMIAAGDADGMVSGAVHTTANTVRPALQIIKTESGTPIVSSVFFMCLPDKVLVYGDVAINPSPSSEELAAIAIASADTAIAFGIEPRIALLSYATGNSNQGTLIQKIADAVSIVRSKRPDLTVEGPLQYDAAINPVTAKIKLKGKSSTVAGKANVFVFPDLNASNICCKAVQQHTGAVAIGPVLQGLKRPVNDLSRGCTVKDIIATIATTAVQAAQQKEKVAVHEMTGSAKA